MPWPLSGPVNPYSQFVSPGVMVQTPKQGETVAPVSAFAPSDLSGLAGWWKADAITALNDGDPVGTWVDSSGNGRDATQGTAAKKPTYRTNVVNGKPVVRFDGVDDYIESAFASLPQPMTIFVVATTTGGAEQIYFDSFNCTTQVFLKRFNATQWTVAASGQTVISSSANDGVHLFAVTFNGASSVSRIDAVQVHTGNYGANGLDGGITLGALCNTSAPQHGDTAELIVYSRALSTTERQQVETYLMGKYGL